MTKYFGTDGARGKANETLTLDMAIKIGQYLGWYYSKEKPAKILIGKDTRLSSDMFEQAVAAGAASTGAHVQLLGVCPTPCVSYLLTKDHFDCGVMISASHNPFYDNGIKLFNGQGFKMNVDIEEEIETYIDDKIHIDVASDDKIGTIRNWHEGLQEYESFLKTMIPLQLNGMKIAVDLANGSATSCVKETLKALGTEVDAYYNEPDGININTNCGSTHPQNLQEIVRNGDYEVGFAFDGDADRLIVIDEKGNILNGDHILYICGCYMKNNNELKQNTIVTTIMANLGLYKALTEHNIAYEQTAVGDKYVFENLQKNNFSLGGEQSGHIIFKEYVNTGDGLLTALKLLQIMQHSKQSLSKLAQGLFIYPQLLVNVPVQSKEQVLQDEGLAKEIHKIETILQNDGRILVRPSGTEPLIRVMVEAKTDALCEEYVYQIVDYMKAQNM